MIMHMAKKMHEASFVLELISSFRIFCIEEYYENIFGLNINDGVDHDRVGGASYWRQVPPPDLTLSLTDNKIKLERNKSRI